MEYALITGAAGVLGSAFCKELASLGCNLFITGRDINKLNDLKTSLVAAYPGVNCCFFAADLTRVEDRKNLFAAAEGYSFNMLINVAGADIQKPFEEYDEQKLTFQTRINFEAAVSMCNFAVKHRASNLKIINICSMCGLQPMPYFALYSACKGALIDFSVALGEETKGQGVTVTAVIPGSIYTRADVVEYINSLGFWARKSAKTPEYVATKSLKAAKKGKRKIVVGGLNKLICALSKAVPQGVKLRYIAKSRARTQKDAF